MYVGREKGEEGNKFMDLFVHMLCYTNYSPWICDMSTVTFVLALKWFSARRGLLRKILSDNAKTFKCLAYNFSKTYFCWLYHPFKSSTDNTLVNYRDCSPRLSNTWVELHWVSLKLHYAVPSSGHFAQWVLSGRAACEYRVFGGEWDVGILQPSTTSPHLVVVLKETKLYLPYRKFQVLF